MAIATKTPTNINNSIVKFVKNYRQEGMTDS
jgi:hypothetical protein